MGLEGEGKEAFAALLTERRGHPQGPLQWADGFSFHDGIETADLVNRKSVEGFAEHHGRPRGTGGGSAKAKASADGWRQWTGVRQDKMACFSTS